MTPTAEVFFHIGLPRTGTTTLQKNLFSRQEYFVVPPSRPDSKVNKFWRQAGIAKLKPSEQCDFDTVRGMITRLIDEAKGSGRRLVISDEGATSIASTLLHQEVTAARLKKVSDHPVVVMVLRRQQDLLRSRYTQLKPWKHWATLGLHLSDDTENGRSKLYSLTGTKVLRFDKWLKHGIAVQYTNWFSNLNYFDLYKAYIDALGKEHVKLLFFEDLMESPQAFSRELGNVLGISAEVVESSLRHKRNESADKVSKRILTSPKNDGLGPVNACRLLIHQFTGTGGFNPKFTPDLKELIRNAWGDQNLKLSEAIGEDLSVRGYIYSKGCTDS